MQERRIFPTQRKQIDSDKWEHIGADGRKYIITKIHGASHERIPAWYQLKVWDLDQEEHEYINVHPGDEYYAELDAACKATEADVARIQADTDSDISVDEQIALAEEQEDLAEEVCSASPDILNQVQRIPKIKFTDKLKWIWSEFVFRIKYIVTFKWIRGE